MQLLEELAAVQGDERIPVRGPPHAVKPAAACGAPGGIRNPNLLIRSQMLYPLSYGRSVRATWKP